MASSTTLIIKNDHAFPSTRSRTGQRRHTWTAACQLGRRSVRRRSGEESKRGDEC